MMLVVDHVDFVFELVEKIIIGPSANQLYISFTVPWLGMIVAVFIYQKICFEHI